MPGPYSCIATARQQKKRKGGGEVIWISWDKLGCRGQMDMGMRHAAVAWWEVGTPRGGRGAAQPRTAAQGRSQRTCTLHASHVTAGGGALRDEQGKTETPSLRAYEPTTTATHTPRVVG